MHLNIDQNGDWRPQLDVTNVTFFYNWKMAVPFELFSYQLCRGVCKYIYHLHHFIVHKTNQTTNQPTTINGIRLVDDGTIGQFKFR